MVIWLFTDYDDAVPVLNIVK